MKKGHKRAVEDRNKRTWQNPILCTGMHEPDYSLPWNGKDINNAVLIPYHKTQIVSAFLPLDFYSLPMWPEVWNDKKKGSDEHYNDSAHPERFSSLFCVACCQKLKIGQLGIHFVSGILKSTNQPAITSDARLMCPKCMPKWSAKCMFDAFQSNKRSDINHLSYFPFMLLAQIYLDNLIDPWKQAVMKHEQQFVQQKFQCVVCRRSGIHTRIKMLNGKSIPLCMSNTGSKKDVFCLNTFYTMLIGDPIHYMSYPCLSPEERLHTLLFHLQHENQIATKHTGGGEAEKLNETMRKHSAEHALDNNFNARLRWDYCACCFSDMKSSKESFECSVCFRVQYCSAPCAKKDHVIHGRYCTPWRQVFNSSRLKILYQRSTSLKKSLHILQCVEDALELRGISECPLLKYLVDKIDMRHLDGRAFTKNKT